MEIPRAMNTMAVRWRGQIATIGPAAMRWIFWGALGLASCGCLGPLWVEAIWPSSLRVNDYFQDWASARNHRVALPVYTPHSSSVPRHLGLPSNPVESIEYNAHPPTSVLLALPLARLDYLDAVRIWNLISLASFLAALAIVAAALPVPRTLFLPSCALLTFCHAIYGNFYQVQLTLLLVLLVAAVWALDRSGRPGAAGLLVGLAAAIKLFPAYLLLYFAMRRRLRPIAAAAASFGALTLATAAILGWDAYRDYLQVVLPRQEIFRSCGFNLSLAGIWYKLFDPAAEAGLVAPLWTSPALARCGTLLSDLAVTAVAAAVVRRARARDQRDLAFGTTVSAMLLVSPVTWDFSLPLLLVPLAVLGRAAGRSTWMPPVLLLILAVFWLPQPLMDGIASRLRAGDGGYSPAYMLGAPSLKFYALLATFALGVAGARGWAPPPHPTRMVVTGS